jgi:hypothetical protein
VSFISGKLVTAGYGPLDFASTTTTAASTATATATAPAAPFK